jgi:hypothetical protein
MRVAVFSALALLAALPALAHDANLGARVIETPTGPAIALAFTQSVVPAGGTCPAGSTGSPSTIIKNTVYRATTAGGEPAPGGTAYAVISPAATSYIDTGGTAGFVPGTTYYYKVTGSNCNAESAESNEASGQIPNPVAPGAPTNLTAQPNGVASLGLQWDPVASNVRIFYNVFRRENKVVHFTRINPARLNGTTYTDSGLRSGTTYHYRVKSWTASGGGSAYSNEVSFFQP